MDGECKQRVSCKEIGYNRERIYIIRKRVYISGMLKKKVWWSWKI